MRWLLLFVLIAACGRPLTPEEASFSRALLGPTVDTTRVRLVPNTPMAGVTMTIPPRPRTTCLEKIVPPRATAVTVRVSPAAVVLFNRVHLNSDWSVENFLAGWPREISMYEALLFGHEMVHVWQWQNRAVTGYHPLKAAREHVVSEDPYLFDADTGLPFLAFGYEQQARIVEEYICCAVLDPEGPRTDRLRALISPAIPVGRLDGVTGRVGWSGVETAGLCA